MRHNNKPATNHHAIGLLRKPPTLPQPNEYPATNKCDTPRTQQQVFTTKQQAGYRGGMTKLQNYSIQELAKQTKIPASTVSYYAKNYNQYLPHSRPEGTKNAVYDSECLDVLTEIRKHQKDGLNKAQILSELAKKFTPIYDNGTDTTSNPQANNKQPSNSSIATTTHQPPNFMQTMSQLAEFSNNQVQLTEHYRVQNQQQSELINELTEKLEKAKEQMTELEEKVKRLEPKKRWWG